MKILAAGVLCVVGVVATSPAGAACVTPPPVIWSYPADGATDVPTNADFITVGSADGFELDGQALEVTDSLYVFELGTLEPNTEYTIEVLSESSSTGGPPSLTFTTGSDEELNEAPSVDPSVCDEILRWQDCFDTGQPESYTLEVDATGEEIAWQVFAPTNGGDSRPMTLWPAQCGDIEVETYGSSSFTVDAIDADGSVSEVEVVVQEDDGEGGGCAIHREPKSPGSPVAWLTLTMAAAFALRRRRLG